MSGSTGTTDTTEGDQRRRQQRQNNSESWGVVGAVAAVAAIGIGYAATKFLSAVPVANAEAVPPPTTDSVDAATSELPLDSEPACNCTQCDECKFLFSLKNYDTALQKAGSKAEFLKQVVKYLCADCVDLKDKEKTSCLQLAIRTKDHSLLQAVMAFWPAVFKRGLDSELNAIDSEFRSGNYSSTLRYIWTMVTVPDPFSWMEDGAWAVGIPSDLVFQYEPPTVVREMDPVKKGARILAVDGGGTRGLILLELLANIEKRARKTIAESFDWVCGTSTGGIILLFLSLGNKRVEDCRKLYFRLKDEVFSGTKPYNSLNFEKLLKEYFPPEKLMKDIEGVKIVITTVTGTYSQLEMKLFTNYYENTKFTPIWEVARMTSAAPSFFHPYEFPAGSKKYYYDGGLMANNPTQKVCSELKLHDSLRNATVVSLGTGKYCCGEQVSISNINESPFGAFRMVWSGELKRLLEMLTNQVTQTEGENINYMMTLATASKCFYVRLTPTLPYKLELDETDNCKLVNAVWHTKALAHVNKLLLEEVVARL